MSQEKKLLEICVVSNTQESFALYKGLLDQVEQVKIAQKTSQEFFELIEATEDRVFVLDISSLKELKMFENISKKPTSKLILITPYTKQFFTPSASLSKVADYIIEKPLKRKKFLSIINVSLYAIKKKNYLKTKEKILSLAIDNSLLRIAIFNTDGKVVYANTNYLLANHIDNIVEDIYFEDFSRCELEFSTIVNRLKTEKKLIVEKQEKQEWIKSLFYEIEEKNIVHICQDITEEKQTHIRLLRSSMFFEQSCEGMMIGL